MLKQVLQSLRGVIERLVAALVDSARRERAVIAVLAAYVVIWTLYGVLAKGSQDIHFDMAELFAWSRDLAIGYAKHPPLAAAVVKAWFAMFPAADWAYYLLSMTSVGLALWLAWLMWAPYLDDEKRVVGLALLTLIPLFNFHALKFNANAVLLPLWAATTLWFLRSFETRSVVYAALAGVGAAASMLGKYWSIYLLAGLGIAALLDRRRVTYFRSPAPWITIGVGAVAVAPHAVWLIAHDFLPFRYAVDVHGAKPFPAILGSIFSYLAGAAAYVALPVVLTVLAIRPDRATLADMWTPRAPERRLVTAALWAPLLLPIPVALATGTEVNPLWTMSAWSLLPVVLLSSPRVALPQVASVQIAAVAVAFPLLMLAVSPIIGIVIHRAGVPASAAHSRLLAERIGQLWRETSDRPLRFIGGDPDLAYGAAFYSPTRPAGATSLDSITAPAERDASIVRDGVALVCPTTAPVCISQIEARAARGPAGRRAEVELIRFHVGIPGAPARYVIVTIPPLR